MRLTPEEFLLFRMLIEKYSGIVLEEERFSFLERRLARLLEEEGLALFQELYERVRRPENQELVQRMMDVVTINETSWFRDRALWEVLETFLLPRYLRELEEGRRNKVCIWSAACSTGQEPYSIMICIHRFLQRRQALEKYWNCFKVTATDISRTAIAEAREGCYDSLAIRRGLEDEWIGQYFLQCGSVWKINDIFRQAVDFRVLNLQHPFAGLEGFDIILLRYVAIYFAGDTRRRLMEKISRALAPEGVLLLGGAEILRGYQELFRQEEIGGGVFFVRNDASFSGT